MKKKYIKRIIQALVFVAIILTFTVVYSAEITVENVTDFGILSTDEVVFTIDASELTSGSSYIVKAEVDGTTVLTETLSPNAENLYPQFTTPSLSKGTHEITIAVYSGLSMIFSHSETVCVMDLYTPQFMDVLSSRGINTFAEDRYFSGGADRWVKLISETGIRSVRGGLDWRYGEGQKDDYSALYTSTAEFVEACRKYGVTAPPGSGWSNKLYPAEDGLSVSDMVGNDRNILVNLPKTPESLEGYANYIMAGLDYFKDELGNTRVSISNEPNLKSFNQSIALPDMDQKQMAGVYTDLFKSVSVQLLKNGYDWADVGGMEIAAYQDEFTQLCFEYGAYPLMDIYTYHPYPTKNGFVPPYESDKKFYNGIDFFENVLIENGGWKQIMWTETGYTNYLPDYKPNQISEEDAAIGIVKMYAYADFANVEKMFIYRLEDLGSDLSDPEDNYGIVSVDEKVKKAVPAITNLNINTNGATMVGNIDLGYGRETHCLVYNKDGVPVILAWSDRTESTTLNIDGTNLIVEDLYGNVISTGDNSVELSKAPVYIKNADSKYFAVAACDTIKNLNDVWLDKYLEKLPEPESVEISNKLSTIEECFSSLKSDDVVLEAIQNYEAAGNIVIELGKNGALKTIEVSQMLYELYKPLEFAVNMYISVYDGETEIATDSYDIAYLSAKADYKDEIKTKQFSDEILNYAKKYSANTKIVAGLEDNPTKAGVIAGWNRMTDVLCGWFNGLSTYEEEINLGLLIQIPHYRKVAHTQQGFVLDMNLTNYSTEDFSGTIVCYDENDNFVAETEKILLPADGGTLTASISFDIKDELGYQRYVLKFISDEGEELASQVADIKVELGFDEAVNAKFYGKTKEVLIRGMMSDFSKFANRQITLFINDKNDNMYVDQTRVKDDGSYLFKFKYNGDVSNADIRINMGGALITDTVIEARYSIYCKISAENQANYLDIITEIENENMFDESYQIIIASYKGDKLVDCYLSEMKKAELADTSTESMSYSWPEDADYVRIYAWTGIDSMIPLGDTTEVIK